MIDDHAPRNHGWFRLTISSKEEGAICDPLRIRTNQVVLQFQTLEGEATYFLFSTTVVFGRRWAVPQVTKRPVIADRGLPPEEPFFLAIQPPPSASRIRLTNKEDSRISCLAYDEEVSSLYDTEGKTQVTDGF